MYAHLENILEIAGCKLFHLGDIVMKAADHKSTKCRNLAESVLYVNIGPFTLSFDIPCIQLVHQSTWLFRCYVKDAN